MAAQDFAYPLQAVAGAAILGLAAVLLRFSSDRRSRRWLGLFLALVGLNHLLIGLANCTALLPDAARAGLRPALVAVWRAADVLQVLDAPALALAVAALAHGLVPRWLKWGAVGFVAACAGAVAAAVPPGAPAWGAVSSALPQPAVLALVAVQLAAFGHLVLRHAREPLPLRRDRLGQAMVAVGVVVLTRAALVWRDSNEVSLAILMAMLATLAILFAAAWALARAAGAKGAWPSVQPSFARLALALSAVCAVWLLWLEPVLQEVSGSLWYAARWVVFALLVAAGIHRIGLLEVGLRGERWLWAGLLATAYLATAFLAWALLAGVGGADPGSSFLAALALAALLTGMVLHLSGSRPAGTPDVRRRQLSVYRAHLEMGTEAAELSRLRERLAIPDDEARRIAAVVAAERQAPATPPLAPGATFAGRYRVEAPLGLGGFGRTFLAVDTVGGGRVVLKELMKGWRDDPKALSSFRAEVQALLAADHPNLVRFRELERVEGGHVLVLDHVEGPTLRERLQAGPMTPKGTAVLGVQLLDGLAALHRQGIVHGDVKPENIVLRDGKVPVLLDFGAARVVSRRTRRDAGLGTAGYLAPERAAGGRPTVASDVYAVGATLWECATGRLPPEGAPPAALRRPLQRALAEDPLARWSGAEAFAEALERA